MDNIEIEIRIKLDKSNSFLKWLKKSAKFIKSTDQVDYYFDPPGKSFIFSDRDGTKNADEWLRVRTKRGDSEICYKYWHRDKETRKSIYADEIETTIGSVDKMMEILKRLGFRQISIIKKDRQSWQYGDFRFDCDDVEGLGFFVEIEYQGQIDDPSKGKEKIFDLLKKIGLKNWQTIKGGYPWMQWNPNNNHFE